MISNPAPLLAIVGPTASGKTDLALRLASEQNAELISVDSRQVYQYLSVGTAKPAGERKGNVYLVQGVPYHLLDIWDPDRTFSAADFLDLALPLIEAIQKRGKKPILVGGTGLYFKALMEGLAPLPKSDPKIREALKTEADQHGREHLHQRLAQVDPVAAEKIPANNIQRLIRALEVYTLTGKPISKWHEEHQKTSSPTATGGGSMDSPSPKRTGDSPSRLDQGRGTPTAAGNDIHIEFRGIDLGRDTLVKRIEARCAQMLKTGMVEETQALLAKGFREDCPALTGLGYPRVIDLLKGMLTADECLALLIQDTRQYAKRQMTWFRHQHEVLWNA